MPDPCGPAVPLEGAQEAVGGGAKLAEALMRWASWGYSRCSVNTINTWSYLATRPLPRPDFLSSVPSQLCSVVLSDMPNLQMGNFLAQGHPAGPSSVAT